MNEPAGERRKQGDLLTGFGGSPSHDGGDLSWDGAAGRTPGQCGRGDSGGRLSVAQRLQVAGTHRRGRHKETEGLLTPPPLR